MSNTTNKSEAIFRSYMVSTDPIRGEMTYKIRQLYQKNLTVIYPHFYELRRNMWLYAMGLNDTVAIETDAEYNIWQDSK